MKLKVRYPDAQMIFYAEIYCIDIHRKIVLEKTSFREKIENFGDVNNDDNFENPDWILLKIRNL